MPVAGETPLAMTLRFPKDGNPWLRFVKRGYEPVVVEISSHSHPDLLRPLWRDAHSNIELVDPIRLPYMPVPPPLESGAARAAPFLGELTAGGLLIMGVGNQETANQTRREQQCTGSWRNSPPAS